MKAPPRLATSLPFVPILFAVWLGFVGIATLSQQFHLGFPVCAWRVLTGMPCPTCGGTRSVLAWSKLQPAQAFRFNPLVALGSIAICAWFVLWLLDRLTGRDWAVRVWRRVQRKPWAFILVAAAVLNWAYLILFLPN